ncbi:MULTISPECIES: enoyl-CoA hydratase-related protein [unclassified Microbacterium]|uniref:enoyl-CoA hydratase/isomerase family protein n=1 Tax=unclassified Microbacterium TaxID=2609290 RepID=UPI0025E5A3A0|nr:MULTISPECIES: enoyl-CoA hydratase-related protein [unclassified Microbacterium]
MTEAVGEVLVERDGAVGLLTLNRPAARNSMTPRMIDELGNALGEFRDDSDIAVVVITGAGDRAFCSGMDLRGTPPTSSFEDQFGVPPQHLSRGMEFWKPVIAAVNGYALGAGFELALSCDLRYASSTASFGLPEVGIGSMPGAGGTQRIIRQAPWALAMELLLTGDRWDAHRIERAGLLNGVVAPTELIATAMDVAHRIARNAPLSLQAVKQAAWRGRHLPLPEALSLERTLFNLIRDTEDRAEGRAAFAEKRPPVFRGR